MPITIIRRDKPFKVRCEDSWIHITPLTPEEDAALREAHTREGRFDEEAYLRTKLDRSVTGWDAVVDQDQEPVPFRREYVRGLPLQYQRRLLRCLEGADDPLVDRWGTTSPPSSASANGTTQTKD